MKNGVVFSMLLILSACVEEENCVNTGEVLRYKTEKTEFYTITVPVYKMECK